MEKFDFPLDKAESGARLGVKGYMMNEKQIKSAVTLYSVIKDEYGISLIRSMMEQGADVNAKDDDGLVQ